ncbi:mannose-6-phosphate isomerase, class I [Priestia megaterium]|uniref:mannose-6-phosphate isomerase, class I n=1 Tax=Priestia megaterium TaxID=1404 RepID=UPI000BEB4E19|nr:mannose-6-phosphate isomerase, class I [Priestia megaterium]MDP1440977.1 mannose-6-phosphate isomerase, class I [Priestia megaterium]MDP1469994.1 mannose-6-phosphate isomerase, class I [Priestia megaterium]MED4836168.1 mannose-6-phosphate isomerase, class I [Priestia megaterium]PEC45808.1 mannose-6-phosphate isomerase, class I [Priestia megaterium]
MKKAPIFLAPLFQERIWGGTELESQYGYRIPSAQTGECWAISAHPNGPNTVREGHYAGKTLGELWDEHPEIFGHFNSPRFPLLTKILDANDDLSIQVHPGDEYAQEFENGELGKTECWYILDCKEDATMIFGHRAQSKEEFMQLVNEGHWNDLLQRVKIKPGDFFYVPSGTLHALCEGTLVLETQQSSDTTYRVYDYNRLGQEGKLRELHLEKAIDVTTIPHTESHIEPISIQEKGGTITTFLEEDYFSVYKWDIQSSLELLQTHHFTLGSVIEGNGMLWTEEGEFPLQKGDHFILPSSIESFTLTGQLEVIASHPNEKSQRMYEAANVSGDMARI